jgi:ubiquitin-activating enzyme E1 C
LFREKDIGRFKSEVAAEYVMKRCPGVQVMPYTKRLEKFDKSFYRQFNVVIAGLDSVDARRWLNAMLVSLVQVDDDGKVDPTTVIPLIDGACEGWKGQARLFFPRLTSCYECSMATLPKQREFAGCTIANVPRLPEHCIAYARKVLWPRCNINYFPFLLPLLTLLHSEILAWN